MASSPQEPKKTRVVIADDHGVLRAGLHSLLKSQPNLEIVGEAATGDETLRVAQKSLPDLVLLDIGMPEPDGIKVTAALKTMLPGVVVLVLTAHEDPELLREALRAGASGYVIKRAVMSELSDAIEAVLRGDLYVHPAVTRGLIAPVNPPAEVMSDEDPLTPREREVLRLLALGYTNQQIADSLTLSVRTVQTHRANLTNKLGIHNRAGLVRYAIAHGLLPKP